VVQVNPQPGIEPNELLYYAAAAEYYPSTPWPFPSGQPIRASLRKNRLGNIKTFPVMVLKPWLWDKEFWPVV